jgi:hypothetical protein
MITGIVTVCGGIAVMLGSGVAISTALAWMNNFDVTLSGKKSSPYKKGGPNHTRDKSRERMAGPRGPGSGLDMFE